MRIIANRPAFGLNYDVGYVGFISRRRDFVAAGINWFSRWDQLDDDPPVSHTFVITGMDMTIEAFTSGVSYGSLAAYLKNPDVALLVRKPRGLTPQLGMRIMDAARSHLGEKYDYGLICANVLANTFVGHWINRLCRDWPNRAVCRLLGKNCRMICSELVATVLDQPELKPFLNRSADTVKPQDLFEDTAVFDPGAIELV